MSNANDSNAQSGRPARQPTPPAPKLAYTMEEAIAATGLGKTSLYEDIAAGLLRAKKRGTRTIFLTEDLAAYLAALPDAEMKS